MRRSIARECASEFREASCVRGDHTVGFEISSLLSLPDKKTGAVGRFFITPHAVNRYRERYRPTASYDEALRELTLITNAGRKVGPTKNGEGEMWRGPRIGTRAKQEARSRMRFIVGRGSSEGELPQVVTILARTRG